MAKRLEFLDQWFADRGFKRFYSSEPVYRKEIKPGVTFEVGVGISTSGLMEDYRIFWLYDVFVKSLAPLHKRFMESTTRLEKLDAQEAGNVIMRGEKSAASFEWRKEEYIVDKDHLGPRWQQLLDVMGPGLVELEREILEADSLFDLDSSPHWRVISSGYAPILIALFERDFDRAMLLADQLTAEQVNPHNAKPKSGRLTVEEEIERAKMLVRDYVAKQQKKKK